MNGDVNGSRKLFKKEGVMQKEERGRWQGGRLDMEVC